MKAAVILALAAGTIFQLAGMIGKGTGAQQSAAAAVSQIYQEEAR